MSAPNLYLLDTNIISGLMREPSGSAMARVRALMEAPGEAQICTSVVVQCELLFGLCRLNNRRLHARYEEAMELITVQPLESGSAEHYAKVRAELECRGTPLGPNDLLIAAHALALGAILVSADAAFARVPGLMLENWLS